MCEGDRWEEQWENILYSQIKKTHFYTQTVCRPESSPFFLNTNGFPPRPQLGSKLIFYLESEWP